MNANSLAQLEKQGQETREALFPREVTFGDGEPLAASVTFGDFQEQLRDGGIAVIRGCSVFIRKKLLPEKPKGDARITVSGAGGGLFLVESVLGEDDPEAWHLRCSVRRN